MAGIRSPICVMAGHVDHGKSSLLDSIRGTSIVDSEPGKITQAIGASIVPLKTIKKICGNLLSSLKIELTIPGLLFLDTPGHAAFTNIRKRGGNLADLAVLVIDINEGVKPQTIEVINILKTYKTPFIIAANKVDTLSGWRADAKTIIESINGSPEQTRYQLDTKLYEIVGKISGFGFDSDRFDRVTDLTKQIAIVPTSAKTGQGIAELLMMLSGLAQRYLEKSLAYAVLGHAKGTILEVKEEKGLGTVIDVIIYDGTLRAGDTIIVGTLADPITTKVKSILEPEPLAEMRDKKSKFKSVKRAVAATGIRISAIGLELAVAGMPVRACKPEEAEQFKEEIKKEVSDVLIETDSAGIIIKADSLGSLEALINLLREKGIPIRKASIGNISKKDLSEAESSYEKDPLLSVIMGFNVNDNSGICIDRVKVLTHNVIYKLIEDFEKWQDEEKKKQQEKDLEYLIKPCKVKLLKGYVFRQSNPAIVGIEVLFGKLKRGSPLMKKDGKKLTEVKEMQLEKENIEEAERGKKVAASLTNVTIGRQLQEEDVLYSAVPESDFRKFKNLKKTLTAEEIEILKEIAEIMRKENPLWGI